MSLPPCRPGRRRRMPSASWPSRPPALRTWLLRRQQQQPARLRGQPRRPHTRRMLQPCRQRRRQRLRAAKLGAAEEARQLLAVAPQHPRCANGWQAAGQAGAPAPAPRRLQLRRKWRRARLETTTPICLSGYGGASAGRWAACGGVVGRCTAGHLPAAAATCARSAGPCAA